MQYKKMMSLALSASLLIGVLAGCKSGKEPDVTTASSSETVTSVETTAAVESSATSEETTKDENVIVFDDKAQAYANEFITGFAANGLGNFDRDKATLEELLDFAFVYLKYNTDENIGYMKKGEVSYQTVTFAQAMKIIGKLFGTGIKEEDCKALPKLPVKYDDNKDGPYYDNGKICFFAADGEEHNFVAVVDSAYNNGDGTQTLSFTLYMIDIKTYLDLENDDISAYYRLTPEKAEEDKTLKKLYTGTATVDIGQSGDYILKTLTSAKQEN